MGILEENIDRLEQYLEKNFNQFEILIVENQEGSPTAEKASKIADQKERIRHFHTETDGKGGAVEKGISESKAEKVGYMDADLATDLEHTAEAAEMLENFSLVIGSRTSKEADRKLGRKIPSLVFNRMVKIILNSDIDDHQCGFKFFKKDTVERLMEEVENKHFFWDTEILVRAQRKDIPIDEIEVKWREIEDSEVDLIVDSLKFFYEIIRLKKDLILE